MTALLSLIPRWVYAALIAMLAATPPPSRPKHVLPNWPESVVRNCAAEVNNTGLTTMRSIQQRNAHAPLFHIQSQGG